jgi:hypothetical protein
MYSFDSNVCCWRLLFCIGLHELSLWVKAGMSWGKNLKIAGFVQILKQIMKYESHFKIFVLIRKANLLFPMNQLEIKLEYLPAIGFKRSSWTHSAPAW